MLFGLGLIVEPIQAEGGDHHGSNRSKRSSYQTNNKIIMDQTGKRSTYSYLHEIRSSRIKQVDRSSYQTSNKIIMDQTGKRLSYQTDNKNTPIVKNCPYRKFSVQIFL